MRVSVLVSALLPLASAAIIPRSATTIVNAINAINANIVIVNNTLNTFKKNSIAGIPTVLKIQSQTSTLLDAVNNATTVARASAVLTKSGSNTVAESVLGLQPNIQSLVDNLVAHKPVFDSVFFGVASASPQVKKDLLAQQNASLALGQALTPKLVGFYATFAPIIIGQINDTFTAAIANFSNSGGKLPVPPFLPPKA